MKAKRRLCDEDCNNCEVTESPQLALLCNILYLEYGGAKVMPIINSVCPNMSVCPICRCDDFCHLTITGEGYKNICEILPGETNCEVAESALNTFLEMQGETREDVK